MQSVVLCYEFSEAYNLQTPSPTQLLYPRLYEQPPTRFHQLSDVTYHYQGIPRHIASIHDVYYPLADYCAQC